MIDHLEADSPFIVARDHFMCVGPWSVSTTHRGDILRSLHWAKAEIAVFLRNRVPDWNWQLTLSRAQCRSLAISHEIVLWLRAERVPDRLTFAFGESIRFPKQIIGIHATIDESTRAPTLLAIAPDKSVLASIEFAYAFTPREQLRAINGAT